MKGSSKQTSAEKEKKMIVSNFKVFNTNNEAILEITKDCKSKADAEIQALMMMQNSCFLISQRIEISWADETISLTREKC